MPSPPLPCQGTTRVRSATRTVEKCRSRGDSPREPKTRRDGSLLDQKLTRSLPIAALEGGAVHTECPRRQQVAFLVVVLDHGSLPLRAERKSEAASSGRICKGSRNDAGARNVGSSTTRLKDRRARSRANCACKRPSAGGLS